MTPSEFVQQLVNALSLGSIYALLALGLSMVYGVLGMLNFAYGELVTICGYSMLWATYMGAPFIVVAIVGVLAACFASVLMELVAFRPLRGASFVSLLFTSFAVAQLIQSGFRQAVSVRSKGIPVPELFDRAVQLGSIRIGVLSIITASIGAVSLIMLTTFMRRSRAGVAMRAAAQDFTTARLSGVRANRVISLAFAISGILAGIAGVLWIARTTSVNPTSGFVPVVQAFIASVIGGLGNLRGAVLGGFFLGTLEVFLAATLPGSLLPYAQAASLLIVVGVLYVRPQGLFGGKAVAAV
jgi:branched-chain amino acid transport system permease protein